MSTYNIYTDGSHLKHTSNRLGIGGILVDEKKKNIIDFFSIELKPSELLSMYNTADVSNPTCELLASLTAIKQFKNYFKPEDNIILYADYNGVKNFCENKWRCKEPYIKKIKEEIDKEIQEQGLKGKIKFEWVRGHQKGMTPDVYWNNYVDLLAKGQKI